MNEQRVLMELSDIKKHFPVKAGMFRGKGETVKAVDGVSVKVYEGETLGLVGESGCGKSTLGNCIMGLLSVTSGDIVYHGDETLSLARMNNRQRFSYSEQVQMVFQDPYSALNPLKTIYDAFDEPMRVHGVKSRSERRERIARLLETVNLHPSHMMRYPHEFSGGQRQRICIARALCLNPRMLVCDEPVSALDVSIQAQVLNLLLDLQKEKKLTYVFVAHDLSVVQYMSDRVAVMYLGRIVELADSDTLYIKPMHPYTQALLSAVPVPDLDSRQERIVLGGDVPSPVHLPKGCRFHQRCRFCRDICRETEPVLVDMDGSGHMVACHFAKEISYE